MAELSIGEVAKQAGIAASAIRYYEAEKLLAPADRRGGRRVYPENVLDQLALIDLAKNAGFTVAEIRQLMRGFARSTPPSKRWQAMTQAKMQELEERIAEARRMQAVLERVRACRCPTMDDCSRAIRAHGGC